MANEIDTIKLIFEDLSGNRFACEVPENMKLEDVAAEFFDDRDWPTRDNADNGQRAVLELVDPENPDLTKRLNGDVTVTGAGLFDGAVLRIFPESIAGAMDPRIREIALATDFKEMEQLAGQDETIRFETSGMHPPENYTVTFNISGFSHLSEDGKTPIISREHRAQIFLDSDYPRRPPNVTWITPIFHPNIDPKNNEVCLGILQHRYLPGLGLARIVGMLAEMIGYRNYDIGNGLNSEAGRWAAEPDNFKFIRQIGGHPFQGPIEKILLALRRELGQKKGRKPLTFKHLNPVEPPK